VGYTVLFICLFSSECIQVYVLGYNIYLLDVASDNVTTVTTDGNENELSYGIPDWVYEGTYSTLDVDALYSQCVSTFD